MTDIDEALVRRLLKSQFPQWAELPMTPVPAPGMDNATFRLGDDKSLRLPRYERWAGQVEREQHWLPRLAPFLPLTVSTPLAMGAPGEGYPYRWSIYRWLDGENADIEGLADPSRAAVDLAGFITALQAVDATGGPGPQWSNAFRGVPLGDPADSIAVEARVRPKIAALTDLADTVLLTEVWETALAAPAWDRPPVWVHGDLGTGNILAADGELSAVIDFGTLAVADPACDVLAAWTFFDGPSRAVFRAALDVDEATWTRARGWGLASSLPVPDDPFFAGRPDRVERALRRLDEIIADHLAHR
ncbi:aminoglycoside phosphotransferase family protein [Phytomonospora endophytica]|uniref:Aminoglycoside phosphotransferase (APT) family kinase protein n=1 Tax=Phytomonospora endophytica TaxID=714109 RepID=A0A841FNF2_9ACTN|nr:aminoglycoside phosphotransferase family protein [Phytomonospora endophytica]MBB6034129.1 aminoglycoside phosphotransferase (APT) family kinase protein [Phytomonospora endophytica]GIG66521.1 aminoglycoside phosphotransferase [Phytomonospora endophytica]